MANWKKVIVSGSNAELKQITASAGITLPGIAAGAGGDTIPLVIDSDGNVTKGSAYALASGGDTVGGSNLTDNVVIVGNGSSAIDAAAGQLLSFEDSHLNNISSITMSGDIVFDAESSIEANTGVKLNITASGIKASTLDISGNVDTALGEGVVFTDSNGLLKVDGGDFKYDGTNKLTITQIENVNSRTHVTASGNIKAGGHVSGSSVTGSNGLAIGIGLFSIQIFIFQVRPLYAIILNPRINRIYQSAPIL